ncbi:TetR/AcrR family transcriptional regulator [Vitiosangium sp. GDMCC 1.1324]|uniref:TetR/AcrR family transcriptional regulator n=1 Tax=Vitiosangium sp. (strain GDMCC 1.1324) TaxID=2138576 RepID=UPI000D355D15|nr:TetR/AcrR family transcriptional regulator [Vitiosangium sp. GDMCC 1.1324]PTL76586.1 TetR family transcriptional regulator [Vitiosangium sp. GDMCC 1.1324]
MGNREDLLAGAKRCLYEKGYGRTTARDIAAASGTSLAAIGYHFKSTEALLNAAILQAIEELGDEIQRALATELPPGATTLERFEANWKRVLELFPKYRRPLSASVEAYATAEHVPEVRQQLAAGLEEGRIGLAQMFHGLDATADRTAWAVGSFYQALMSGLVVQWLIDPEHAPSSKDLTDALRTIVASVAQADAKGTAQKEKAPKGTPGKDKARKGKAPPGGGKQG